METEASSSEPKTTSTSANSPPSKADRAAKHCLERLIRFHVILIDQLSYLVLKPEQINLIFKLMDERYSAQEPTLVTKNLEVDDWGQFHLGRNATRFQDWQRSHANIWPRHGESSGGPEAPPRRAPYFRSRCPMRALRGKCGTWGRHVMPRPAHLIPFASLGPLSLPSRSSGSSLHSTLPRSAELSSFSASLKRRLKRLISGARGNG